MKKHIHFIIYTISIIIFAFLLRPLAPSAKNVDHFIAFDRVMETREIRCGYVLYPPFINRDVNLNKMTGPMVRIWDEIGQRLNLKIRWMEEVTWGTMLVGLQTGRYDAVCSPVWANGQRSMHVNFSIPLGYERLSLYARKNDTRFDNDIDHLNSEKIKFSTMDGEMAALLVTRRFPKALQLSLPQNSSVSDMLENIVTKKADLALADPLIADQYMENNPNSLHRVKGGETMQSFPVTVLLPQWDIAMKTMIDQTLSELQRDGTIQKIMNDAGMPDQWRKE